MTHFTPAHQAALGTFLLGLASLAIFDFWFPGTLIVISVALFVAQHTPHLAWAFLATGSAFWLRDILHQLELAALFPPIMIGLGVALLLTVDLRQVGAK